MTANGYRESRLSVMNFLNEVQSIFGSAISFASGRPCEAYFNIDEWAKGASPHFQKHVAKLLGVSEPCALRRLAQYGPTKGIINDLVACQLKNDENIFCSADRVLITAGCQEAIALCLHSLCSDAHDVVLVRNPTYVGVTGVCDLAGIALHPLKTEETDYAGAIERAVTTLAAEGKRARALYLIPSFDNPTGTSLTTAERYQIMAVCLRHRIVILEDNPYGMFRFEGDPLQSMAALDSEGVVVYLGTYSKTLCPAIRIGCVVVPEALFGDPDASKALMTQLAARKSFLTVNTSQLNQALLGGVLLEEECSLERIVTQPREHYRINRDVMLKALYNELSGIANLQWNFPEGGFFIAIDLPFDFGSQEVNECASMHGVIPMPMSFFALDDSQTRRVRLAFSDVTSGQVCEGVSRFAQFIRNRLRSRV